MAMYWTFGSLPELNHLSERERHHVLSTCAGPSAYFRLVWVALFYALGAAALSRLFFSSFLESDAAWILSGIVAGLMFVFSYQFCMRIIRSDLRITIVEGFEGLRLPVCLGCGYDLKGIDADQCPECGKGITVRAKRRRGETA